MSQIEKTIVRVFVLLAFLIVAASCSNKGSKSVFDSDAGEHPTGWVSSHGNSYHDDQGKCEDCHGTDLLGGISKVSCNSTSYNGISCHPGNDSPHLATLKSVDGSVHPGNTSLFCGKCHDPNNFQNNVKYQCQRCHADPSDTSDPLNGTLKARYPDAFPYGFGSAQNVVTHSSTTLGNKYGSWGAECVTCHNPHEQDQNNQFGTSYGKLIKRTISFNNQATGDSIVSSIQFTANSGSGSFADGAPHDENICETCHTRTNHHQNDGTAPGGQSHNDGLNCMICHLHTSGLSPEGGTPSGPHSAQEFMNNCDYCHVVDGQGAISYLATVPDSKCEQCHTAAGALKASFPTAVNVLTHSDAGGSGNYVFSFACVDCHDPMSDQTNLKSIRSNISGSIIPGSNIDFTAITGTGSFADGLPYEQNVCDTCHSLTNHHQSDGTAPGGQSHNDGSDCTACHAHGNGFVPQIVPPPLSHNALNCESCHLTPDTYVTGAAIPNSACDACHGAGSPGSGSGGSDTNVDKHFSATYTDPQTGALLNLNCVECHNPMETQTNFRGNANRNFIRSVIRGNNVAFEATSGQYSFADDSNMPVDMLTENYLCNACHTQANHHQSDGTAPGGQSHYDGMNCAVCHDHSGGFTPGVATPPAPHDTQAFLNNCDYCHLDDGMGGIDLVSKIPDSKCEQCHTAAGALKGSFATAPNVLSHSDTNGSGSYTYTNDCVDCHDPMTAQTNRKLIRSTLSGSIVGGSTIAFAAVSGQDSFADGAPYDENLCDTCHSQTKFHQSDGTATIGQTHNDGTDCTTCHAHTNAFLPDMTPPPGAHSGIACTACHVSSDTYKVNAAIPNSACESCHETGTPNQAGGGADVKLVSHYSSTYTDPTTGQLLSLNCVECHNPMRAQINFRNNTNLSFIRSTIRGNSIAFEATTGQYSFADDSSMPAGMTTQNYLCNACHTQTNHHQADGTAPGVQSHNDGTDCTGCHAHNAGFIENATPPPPPHNALNCVDCHLTSDTYVLNAAIPDAACEACHLTGTPGTGAGGSDTKVVTHSGNTYNDPNTGQPLDLNCVDCHNPMRTQTNFLGNTNRKFTRTTVRGASVAFEATTGQYSFADDSNMPGDMSTANYLCNTCHTQTDHHQSDGTAPIGQSHNDGANCTGCHAHLDGFQPDTSSCLLCHNQSPPGGSLDVNRRQITEGTAGDGNGDFVRTTHHVTNGTASQIVAQADCLICHDQGSHQTFGDGVSVLLKDQDGGASYTYNGTVATAENFCLSCHDGNHPTPFPSDSNNPADMETDWSGSAHQASGAASCLNCHAQGHGSDFAKMLTEDNEPGFCYNCHGAAGPGDDIESEFAKSYGHPVSAAASQTQCLDCHNPHKALTDTHVVRNPAIAGVLKGVSGADPSYPANTNWAATGTPPRSNFSYSVASTPTAEYQVCFRCHSYFNTSVLTDGGSGAAAFTDQGLEFNPNNQSYHPVIQALPANDPSGSYGSKQLAAGQLANGWSPGDTMTCSDCHANDAASPKGPHGSATKWMLTGNNKAWPYTSAGNNGTSSGTFFYLSGATTNLFCMNCHPDPNGTNNVHTKGDHRSSSDGRCMNCHIRVPHGGKVSRLISANNNGTLPSRYYPDGNGGGTVYLRKFERATNYTNYNKSNCYSTVGACSDHNNSGNGTESW